MIQLGTVKCFRCEKQRSIFDVMYIPVFNNPLFSKEKYLCGYCICELANYWRERFHTEAKK